MYRPGRLPSYDPPPRRHSLWTGTFGTDGSPIQGDVSRTKSPRQVGPLHHPSTDPGESTRRSLLEREDNVGHRYSTWDRCSGRRSRGGTGSPVSSRRGRHRDWVECLGDINRRRKEPNRHHQNPSRPESVTSYPIRWTDGVLPSRRPSVRGRFLFGFHETRWFLIEGQQLWFPNKMKGQVSGRGTGVRGTGKGTWGRGNGRVVVIYCILSCMSLQTEFVTSPWTFRTDKGQKANRCKVKFLCR